MVLVPFFFLYHTAFFLETATFFRKKETYQISPAR